MPLQLFIDLPVTDLPRSIAFYEAIGATRNPQFSDETAACMVLSDTIYVMLLTHAKWSTFTRRSIADTHTTNEVMMALSTDSRATVDRIVAAATTHGGTPDINPVQDLGFMYNRSFTDPDGHIWMSVYMDMSMFPQT